jgi:hypothetical protein
MLNKSIIFVERDKKAIYQHKTFIKRSLFSFFLLYISLLYT